MVAFRWGQTVASKWDRMVAPKRDQTVTSSMQPSNPTQKGSNGCTPALHPTGCISTLHLNGYTPTCIQSVPLHSRLVPNRSPFSTSYIYYTTFSTISQSADFTKINFFSGIICCTLTTKNFQNSLDEWKIMW